jgi:integrase
MTRLRGTGSVFGKKGTRFLYISYYSSNGVQIQESTKSESRQVAEAMLRDRLSKVEQGLPVEELKTLRYKDLKTALLTDYKIKGNKTFEEEGKFGGLAHLDDFFGNQLVRSITSDSWKKFVQRRQQAGAANGTINRARSLLVRMFNIAKRDGKLSHIPHFMRLREAQPRNGFLTPVEFTKLRDEVPEHLRPLLVFLYFTGCRLGAAQSVKWNQIEFRNDRALLSLEGFQTKNDEPLTLPLPKELHDELKAMKRSSGLVFDTRNLRKSFQTACVKVGLGVKTGPKPWQYKGLLIHDLRRSGVRNLIRSGVHRTIAMRVSGHKTEAVFERYNISDSADLLDAMTKVESHFDVSLREAEAEKEQSNP